MCQVGVLTWALEGVVAKSSTVPAGHLPSWQAFFPVFGLVSIVVAFVGCSCQVLSFFRGSAVFSDLVGYLVSGDLSLECGKVRAY